MLHFVPDEHSARSVFLLQSGKNRRKNIFFKILYELSDGTYQLTLIYIYTECILIHQRYLNFWDDLESGSECTPGPAPTFGLIGLWQRVKENCPSAILDFSQYDEIL